MKIITAMVLSGLMSVASALEISDNGIWFEPDLSGHGLIITTYPDFGDGDQLLGGGNLTWFTQTPDGSGQAWFFSDNLIFGQSVVDIYLPTGSFPAFNFSLGVPAGQLEITKLSDNIIRLDYQIYVWEPDCDPRPQAGPLPSFCAGTITLKRLTPELPLL